jgi:S1-C subfamily serine protease
VTLAEFATLVAATDSSKDVWDKLSAVSGLVAGVLVAVIGAFATYVYNRRQEQATAADAERQRSAEDARAERQLAVLRVQTIETFFPHLKSADARDREAALVAIHALGDHDLAAQFAVYYGGEAAIGALARIATAGDDESARHATEALATVLGDLRASVVQIVGGGYRGTGFVVAADGVVATAAHVVQAMGGDTGVRFADGETRPASIVYPGRSTGDLALLKIEGDRLPSLPVATTSPLVGDSVVTLGFGVSGGESVTVGTVTDVFLGDASSIGEVQTRIRTEPGFSGAPLVNQRGEVVAIQLGVRPNPDGTKTAFAVPAAALSEALAAASGT